MHGEQTRALVLDLIEFGDMAARLVARGKDAYDEDEVLRLASEALLHRIGEAVARLMQRSPDFVAEHPEIEWVKMRGTRNIVAHNYYSRIDHEIIWNALATKLPDVTSRLRRALDDG